MKLDHVKDVQLIDCEGRRCGKVDAVERDKDGNPTTILCGAGAWPRWLQRLLHVPPDSVVEVPWSAVEKLGPYVHLNARAQDLGLGRGDDELRYLLQHLPWRDAQ